MNSKDTFLFVLAKLLNKLSYGNSVDTVAIQAYLKRLSIGGWKRECFNYLFFLAGSSSSFSYPRSVRFEVSSRCNLRCPMCPQPVKMSRPRQLLDIELYKLVINRNPKIEEVDLFNWGEPLLHEKLSEFISYASEKGIFTRLVTNAVLLNKERSISLLSAGLDSIIFSLDNIETRYQQIRGTPYVHTMENVKFFIDHARNNRYPIQIGINMTHSSHNQTDLPVAAKEFKKLGVDRVDIHDCQEYKQTYRRVSRCIEPYRYMVILSDGRVTPCCVDYDGLLSFGSVLDEPDLGILFKNKVIQQIRQALQSSETMRPPCTTCHYRVRSRHVDAN